MTAHISFTGNATSDAELRFTPSGAAVANVTIAVTPRVKDGDGWKDGDPAFYRVAAWRQLAENVAESVKRGNRVTVTGQLKPRTFEHNGAERLSLDVDADSVALDLRFATATATKAQRQQPAQQSSGWGQQQAQQAQGDPWQGGGGWAPTGAPANAGSDEPPFAR